MVPMLDPMMMPEATTMLLAVSPSLLGVTVAFLVALAVAAVGTARELGGIPRPRAAEPGTARSSAPAPLPA